MSRALYQPVTILHNKMWLIWQQLIQNTCELEADATAQLSKHFQYKLNWLIWKIVCFKFEAVFQPKWLKLGYFKIM